MNTAPPIISATTEFKRDFADGLSPMLVKELRQGMRTRLFVTSFLLLQLFLLVYFVLGTLTLAFNPSRFRVDTFNVFFWFLIVIPLLIITPLRGLNAISSEIKANTLELIYLTRLSAWRIVFGKWASLIIQSLLLVITLIPYMILRYFYGGINIVEELKSVGVILAFSSVLTAITLSLSTWHTALKSLIVAIFSFSLFPSIIVFSFASSSRGFSIPFSSSLFLLFFYYTPLLVLFFLEFAASQIAAPAENYSFRKRILAFFFLPPIFFLKVVNFPIAVISGLLVNSLPFLGLVCVGALCEKPLFISSLYQPFIKRGQKGKILGRFFYPGWPFGACYTLLLGGVLTFLLWFLFRPTSEVQQKIVLSVMAVLNGLLMPVWIREVLFPRAKNSLVWYIGIQIFFGIVTLFLGVIGSIFSKNDELFNWTAFLPISLLISAVSDHEISINAMALGTVSTLLTLLFLFWKTKPFFKKIESLEISLSQSGDPVSEPISS